MSLPPFGRGSERITRTWKSPPHYCFNILFARKDFPVSKRKGVAVSVTLRGYYIPLRTARLAPTAHRAARQNATLTSASLNLSNPFDLLSFKAIKGMRLRAVKIKKWFTLTEICLLNKFREVTPQRYATQCCDPAQAVRLLRRIPRCLRLTKEP